MSRTRLGKVEPVCYNPRGVLPLDEFHHPRRLERWLRSSPFTCTRDRAFDQVIAGCADRSEVWISHEIEDAFKELHRAGHAHSVETWQGDELVGGLYGLALGGTFCGESMFSRASNASKAALVHLAQHLKTCGFRLIDCQSVTSTLAQFGARHVPYATYMEWFRGFRDLSCNWNA